MNAAAGQGVHVAVTVQWLLRTAARSPSAWGAATLWIIGLVLQRVTLGALDADAGVGEASSTPEARSFVLDWMWVATVVGTAWTAARVASHRWWADAAGSRSTAVFLAIAIAVTAMVGSTALVGIAAATVSSASEAAGTWSVPFGSVPFGSVGLGSVFVWVADTFVPFVATVGVLAAMATTVLAVRAAPAIALAACVVLAVFAPCLGGPRLASIHSRALAAPLPTAPCRPDRSVWGGTREALHASARLSSSGGPAANSALGALGTTAAGWLAIAIGTAVRRAR